MSNNKISIAIPYHGRVDYFKNTLDSLVAQSSKEFEIVKSCIYVDEVVIQDDLDKVKAWEILHYDICFSGDDWQNSLRWKGYEKELQQRGAKIEFLPYTKTTSSTAINEFLNKGYNNE